MADLSELGYSVSRETNDRLRAFVALVLKWTPKINLIARADQAEIWQRHILDSAQIYPFLPKDASDLVDLGSGGGFPGVVLAILSAELLPDLSVTMIESDQRKATFLRTAIRETGCNATVLTTRIEAAAPQNADVVTARALAPLETLLPLVERHLAPNGVALLPKGSSLKQELSRVNDRYQFEAISHKSLTNASSHILELRGLRRDSDCTEFGS